MKIGIIGAGFVGRVVAQKAIAVGHDVMLSNSRGPQTLFSQRAALQCATGTIAEAIAFGDIVVIAIPLPAYATLDPQLFDGRIVIDAANYYFERDGHIAALDRGETTTSEMIAAHLPKARLVKAFNAIRMVDLETNGMASGAPGRNALPLCGDDAAAKALVATLYDQFGFDTVDAGLLAEGWRFERGRPAYCVPMDRETLEATLAGTTR